MKRLTMCLLVIFSFVYLLALAPPAAAITIGTITNGTGSVTLDGGGNPVSWYLSGHFAYDNTTLYSGHTLAYYMGDAGQYTLSANSAGGVQAWDYNGYIAPASGSNPRNVGTYQYVIGSSNSSTFYGAANSFSFSGGNTGAITTLFASDGYIHWYYGFDDTTSPTNGRTAISGFGLSNDALMLASYTETGGNGLTKTFSFNGSFEPVPLPGAVWLLGSGLAGLGILKWPRRKA